MEYGNQVLELLTETNETWGERIAVETRSEARPTRRAKRKKLCNRK